MAELHLQLKDSFVSIQLSDIQAACAWAEIKPTKERIKDIRHEAVAYGRFLFDHVFANEALRTAITHLPDGERLLLVTDEACGGIPWEYLREPDGTLLAGRVNVLRGLPEAQRKPAKTWSNELELLAVVSSPINETRRLNVEQEWRNLIKIAETSKRAFGLTRVRPPEPARLARALGKTPTTWVWFMGHGGVSEKGDSLLQFEDAIGDARVITAKEFARDLDDSVQLVMLNSCQSSAAGEQTEFGNAARAVVSAGAPYALGMQFSIPDDIALKLSETLFDFLLNGRSIEEATRRTRRALASESPELAGLPALYTCQTAPLPALALTAGAAAITPDPKELNATFDMNALAQASHFTGREQEMSRAIAAIARDKPAEFVVLHGIGGAGKTALARAIADRVGWRFDDRGLAVSFETFARLEQKEEGAEARLVVNPQFAEAFTTQLARFYGLDPARYTETVKMQEAILQARQRQRSLLALDNLETLLDALGKGDETARALAAFIKKLREGQGAIVITSRDVPPPDWGEREIIEVEGLQPRAGANLFCLLLNEARRREVMVKEAEPLSERVYGHPLALRLLAARFNETSESLPAFAKHVDEELARAEQNTPDSLYDNQRQRTLDNCFGYSVARLSETEKETLRAATVFRAPFIAEFAAAALDDPDNTAARLYRLVELSVLEGRWRVFAKGGLAQFELHPALRPYASRALPPPNDAMRQRTASMYLAFGWEISRDADAFVKFNVDERLRLIVQDGLADFDAALLHLPDKDRANLAYLLADPLIQFGYVNRALELLQLSAQISTTLGDVREVAVTESSIADLLVSLGRPDEAMRLYEKSLKAIEQLGDVRSVAVTESKIADLLVSLGRPDEAMRLYEKSLKAIEQLGDVRSVAVTESKIADLLVRLGRPDEAMRLYEKSLKAKMQLGDVRSVAVTRANRGQALIGIDKLDDGLRDLLLAYTDLRERYPPDAAAMRNLFIQVKAMVGAEVFDTAWGHATTQLQPDWLQNAPIEGAGNTGSGGLGRQQLDTVVNNTVAVLTFAPDKYEEWRANIKNILAQAQGLSASDDVAFLQAVLALMDAEQVSLPAENAYHAQIEEIKEKLKHPPKPQHAANNTPTRAITS